MRTINSLGPGLLFAGAAIGVSHLVQATRAGADFGFGLMWAIIFAHVVKYPFFEAGPRYASATGKSLIFGYSKLGKWGVPLFIVLTVSTMFSIQAAVTLVTAGLVQYIFGIYFSPALCSALILTVCIVLLVGGKYALLDKLIKYIVVLLSITTILALISAGFSNSPDKFSATFNWSNSSQVFFLIALIGWMPAPLDISVWHSVWAVEKQKISKSQITANNATFDFKVGFFTTALLALCFMALGTLVFFNKNISIASSGIKFAEQLIHLYTFTLHPTAFWIIAIAALTTMFSTTLTCLDAFPRVLQPAVNLLKFKITKQLKSQTIYVLILILTSTGAFLLLSVFASSMHTMVDLATTLSFVTTPVYAFLNYKAIYNPNFPEQHKPSIAYKSYTLICFVALFLFAVYFLIIRFY